MSLHTEDYLTEFIVDIDLVSITPWFSGLKQDRFWVQKSYSAVMNSDAFQKEILNTEGGGRLTSWQMSSLWGITGPVILAVYN